MSVNWGDLVFGLLKNDPEVAGFVVTQTEARIYPNTPRQGSDPPRIVYTVVSSIPVLSLAGATASLRWARIQFDCDALTYKQSQQLGNAVEDVLEGLVQIGFSSLQEGRRESYDGDTKLHRASMDFKLWRNET